MTFRIQYTDIKYPTFIKNITKYILPTLSAGRKVWILMDTSVTGPEEHSEPQWLDIQKS